MKVFCKIFLCISVFCLAVLCSACGPVEYSVQDFADVTVIGYTEHGTLAIKVNEAAVNQIYADGKKDKTAALRFAETFKFTYDGQNEEDSYFSNGDVVTINVAYDESMARSLGVNFVDSSFEYTVNGLEDKLELSPFEGLSVKFSGVAPYGSVQLDKSNCIQYIIDNVTFYCDNHDLSNGDKVVVRAEFNSEIAERNGYVFTEDVKKYTVVGLSKYVTSMMGVSYSSITARMHYMVEKYISDADTSYKSLDWYFGEEEPDTDESTDDELFNDDGGEIYDDPFAAADDENQEEGEGNEPVDGETTESEKPKKLTNIEKIKNDFLLSDFKASFDYTPVGCFYALNPIQYSDNQFSALYKVTGKFVCEESAGAGYIKPGDTVVGEVYVIATLTGGSVDVKNNLFYDDTVLKNYHSYSIRSMPEYSDASVDIYGSTKYLVENLDYVEDQEAYEDFVKDQETTHSRRDVSHITIDTSTDKNSNKRENSSQEESLIDSETSEGYPEENPDGDPNEDPYENNDNTLPEDGQQEYYDAGYEGYDYNDQEDYYYY